MTTPTPSIEVPAQEKFLHKHKERVQKLSQQDRVMKICTDAGFLKTVEVGQYFMTKDTDEFSQFTEPVTCREYTLPRDEKSTSQIGPVLEVTTNYLQAKYGVEIRIESVNKDNSHSWVRISHGLNSCIQSWSTKSTATTSRRPLRRRRKHWRWKRMYLLLQADQRLKQSQEDLTLLLIYKNCTYTWKNMDWYWTRSSIQSGVPSGKKTEHSSSAWTIISRRRWGDRILENKDNLRNDFENSQYWSDEMWKSKMAGGGGNKKRFQYCTDSSGQGILYPRALQGHKRRNPIDPTLQDSVLITDNFFEYIYHIGCAIRLHSITNSGLIAGGQNSSKERQTIFFTAWLDQTTSCIVQAEEVEKRPRYGVLGRFTACSTKKIEVLSNKM